jgi:ADP-ribose pyrophosphatase YjhB (NUDIX family)
MNFEPQKFFIGLMDFFSILLPGALLTYLLMGEVGPVVLGAARYQQLADTEGSVVFLVASYLFGHLIFLLGTWLDEFYDMDRRLTLNQQIKLLANRGRLLPWRSRVATWLVFRRESDFAVERAMRIKDQMLSGLQAKNAINTFQWAKVLLAKEHPENLATVQRFEADSKFFRSFAVVLILLAVTWPVQHRWPLSGLGIVLVLLFLAMWRYMEQRFKSTNQAYWAIITLTAKEGMISLKKPVSAAGALTHAGGVVYRRRETGAVEYLLVEAKDDYKQLVLPKGHIEAGENSREAAVREVHEETGVWGRIIADLGPITFTSDATAMTTQFFLMEYAGRGLSQEASREYRWLPFEEARAAATYPETQDLLKSAQQRLV